MSTLSKSILLFCSLISVKAQCLIRLYPGYVTRLACQGKLLVSAIGNDQLVRLESLPKELGCGAILKPIAQRGSTNVILETSTGTIRETINIELGSPRSEHLSITLEPTLEQEEMKK